MQKDGEPMRKLHAVYIGAFFFFYALSYLPNFNIFNEATFIGFFPQPLIWVLLLNALNTVIIFIVYKKFFKPFAERAEREFEAYEEGEENK
ncbi:hypothetical protein M3558_06140 [Brevibacillus invocatus]|nr:hypothetical protein [Brevibacillus invocatus]